MLAINHLAWIDVPLVGVALAAQHQLRRQDRAASACPASGRYIDWHGIIAVRRGESDREAVRRMRRAAADGRAIGVFVEGTRQRSGRPGRAQPGAAMVAIQESVPVVPIAVYGTQFWKPGNFAPCSIASGEPVRFEARRGRSGAGLPGGERSRSSGASTSSSTGSPTLHARGRPRGETPPL